MTETMHINEATFEEEVLKSSLPVVVDFWAPWCAPCRMVAPALDKLAQEYNGRLKVVKLNVDENPNLSLRYNVRSIPLLMFIKGGQVLYGQAGALPYPAIRQLVDQLLMNTPTGQQAAG